MPSIWTTPVTKANQDPTLFGDWNTYLRDNLLYLYDRAINNSGLLIASTTVTAAATYTFSAIPGTYKHLRVRGYRLYTVTANAYMRSRLNGDSGNDYKYGNVAAVVNGTTTYANGDTVGFWQMMGGDSLQTPTDRPAFFEMDIFDYANTSFEKVAGWRAAGNFHTSHGGGMYTDAGNAAITSLEIYTSSGNNFWGELELWGWG